MLPPAITVLLADVPVIVAPVTLLIIPSAPVVVALAPEATNLDESGRREGRKAPAAYCANA